MSQLTDSCIINDCKILKVENLPEFLTENSKKKLIGFLKGSDEWTDGYIPDERIDKFHVLWKNLLSDAITYLKSKDKREFKDEQSHFERDRIAFGVHELQKYFSEYRSFEAILYGADNFYRDHVMHVFRVWLLGIWLIKNFKRKIHWDSNDIRENKDLNISDEEVSAMWCVVALTHDLGYPLNKIEKVREKIASMLHYFGGTGFSEKAFQIPVHHHFINDFILRFISSKLVHRNKKAFGTATQSKYYLKFSKSLENFDHGIVSCIVLMKNLVYFLESDLDLGSPFDVEDARQFYIRREILRSIASHTCTDIYHLHPNSMAFILILADEIQAWGRPTFREIKSGRRKLEVLVKKPTISDKEIKIVFEVTEKNPDGDGEGGKDFFLAVCRKWNKWLRSALDAGGRKFNFHFEANVKSEKGTITAFKFESKPGNYQKVYVDNKEEDFATFLYQ